MDFGDSPAEAEFRQRLREWLVDHNPGLPTSSTDDDYWAGMAAWHQTLFAGGFFGGEEVGEGGVAVGLVVGAVAFGLEIVEEALGEMIFVFDDDDEGGFGIGVHVLFDLSCGGGRW